MYLSEYGGVELAVKTYVQFSSREDGRLHREVSVLKDLALKQNVQQLHNQLNPEGVQTICTIYAGAPLEKVPLSTAQNYIIQVCQAMHGAQEKEWCHRDLHPGNIVVSANGIITVVDWEVALQNNDHIINLTGIPGFASTRLLEYALNPLETKKYKFSWFDDLESIAYLVLKNNTVYNS